MKYNVQKLHNELEKAGIPIHGVSSDGRIDFKGEATSTQKLLAEDIKAKHNPIWYYELRAKEYPPIKEQLDMLYKDRLNGTNKWFETIQAIKLKYPKN